MNKSLNNLLHNLNFSSGEIENLVSIAPVLDTISIENVTTNLNLLVAYNYPADDLTYLIAINPGFLCRNSNELKQDLEQLSIDYNNIEEALKNDPFLI